MIKYTWTIAQLERNTSDGGVTERNRLGVRYPELLAFIIGAL